MAGTVQQAAAAAATPNSEAGSHTIRPVSDEST